MKDRFVLEKPNVLTKEYKSTEREAVVDGEALQRKIKVRIFALFEGMQG